MERQFARPSGAAALDGGTTRADDERIPVLVADVAGRSHRVERHDVRFVEACGDYVRLHTPVGAPLVRISLATLEEAWAAAGFVRVHRRYLVALAHVRAVRLGSGAPASVLVHDREVPVSRRQAREVRHLLLAASA